MGSEMCIRDRGVFGDFGFGRDFEGFGGKFRIGIGFGTSSVFFVFSFKIGLGLAFKLASGLLWGCSGVASDSFGIGTIFLCFMR